MANTALRTPAQSPADKAIPASHLQHLLAAHNAAGLAQSYLERGNFTAARRKLVLALHDIETAIKEGGAA